ncbi:MAG: DUF945 family protein [Cardiobacteriaceae bacterium]|nr:DUF945 family protein [Cardiobacteriaceae bacterium]
MKFKKLGKTFSKSLLAASLVLALASCGEDDKKPVNQAVSAKPAVVKKAAGKTYTGAEQAEVAEKRYRQYYENSNQMLAMLFKHQPIDIKFNVDEYVKGEQNSTAKTSAKITVKGEESLDLGLNLSEEINHDDALAADKKIAVVKSKYSVQVSGEKKPLPEELNNATAEYLDTSWDILADGSYQANIAIKPVNKEENGTIFKYDGLTAKTIVSDLDKPVFPFTAEIKSGELKFFDTEDSLTLTPIDITAFRDEKGAGEFKISPFKLESKDQFTVNFAKGITFKEQDKYDAEIETLIAETTSFSIPDVTVGDKKVTVEIAEISGNSATTKKGSAYSSGFSFKISPKTDLVKMLAGMDGLAVKSTEFEFNFAGMSVATIKEFQELMGSIYAHKSDDEVEKLGKLFLEKLIPDLAANNGEMKMALKAETEAGKAHANLVIKVKKDAKSLTEEDIAVLDSKDEKAAMKIITDRVLVNVDISVAKDILAKSGVEAMLLITAKDFVKEENGNYVFQAELTSDGLKVNGKAIPL